MDEEPRPYEEIIQRALADYNRSPKGWHVLLTKSQGIGHNLYILRPEGAVAMLKLESIYKPNPVGIGVETTGEMLGLREIVKKKTYPFGIRPIPEEPLVKILSSIRSGSPPEADLITKIMQSEPVSQEALTTPLALQGPILHMPSPLPSEYASTHQRELESKLQRELERLLEQKYGYAYIG